MKVNVTFRNVLSCTYARQFFLLILLLCGYGVVNAQVSPSVPATTKNHKKQVIGYITQWDAWKDVSGIVPKGGYNQLNVDYSQYTILNFSFFGVAKDGSLHSGDYRNKSIYQVGAVQEPAALVNEDIYSSWDMFLLYGELDAPLYYISDGSYPYTLGYRNAGSGWSNVNTGATGVFPLSVPKQGGAPGLIDLAHQKGVKVMASIGGWSMCKHYPEMAADATKRATFVAGCKKLMTMGFDGIDFDWEYPGGPGMNIERFSAADYTNFAIMVEAVRAAIGPDKLITAAFSASPAMLSGFDWPRLSNSMNYFNMMTYDYNGGWSNKAGHNAPLYDYPGAEYSNFSIDATVKALKALNVNMAKVNIGAPFYGRGVITSGTASLNAATQKTSVTLQPDGPVSTCADFTNWALDLWDGTPNYSALMKTTASGWTEYWDDVAKVPYKTKGNYFLSYDNERSIEEKAKYIKNNSLAGVIVWQVYGDMTNMTNSTVAKGKLIYCPATISPLVNKLNQTFADGSTPGNVAPVVNLTAPTANSSYTAPASITINATATDSDGTVAKVEFYNGSTKLGEDATSPYTYAWSNVPAGTYSLKAIATDNSGASTTSSTVSVTVNGTTTNPGTGGVVVGYWHNWNLASAPYIRLRDVDSRYNVIEVAFGVTASDYATVSFTPDGASVADFKADIAALQAQGRKVLLSIGGETGIVVLDNDTKKQAFINSLKSVLDNYNFDGFDIDIEGGTSLVLNNGDNNFTAPTTPKVVNLIAATKEILAYRKAQGKNALLTMAPETYYVQTAYGATYSPLVGAYLPIIYGLRDQLSWIQPQLYNTGSVNGLDNRVYNSATADFIVAMTEMLLQGFPVAGTNQTFPALREDQVAFGLPAAPGAAGSGYTAVSEVKKALNYLLKGTSYGGTYTLRKASGYPAMRGIMTWSVNWDAVNNKEFATNYAPFFTGTVVNPGNQSPVVSITSPAANATFNAPASVTINASASDADGTVSKVEFYNGATKLGEDATSPYTYSWSNVAAGSYSLTAKATDNSGAVTTSGTVSIVVNGTGSGTCDGIAAWTAAGVYTNGMQVVYNSKIYTAQWWTSNEQPDTHTGSGQVWLYVRDCGGVTNPNNQAPAVSITSPAGGASFAAPASVNISASASDADGTVAKVEFYSAGAKIGESTNSPFSYTWSGVAAGTYSLTAKATDNGGATTTSGTVNITVTGNSGNTGNCAGVAAYAVYPAIYNMGDKVVYNGYLYESLASSLYNVTPGTADWWWKPLGACSSGSRIAVAAISPEPVNAVQALVVYPNPVTGSTLQVQVNAAAAEKVYLEIWSVNGTAPVLHKEYTAGAKGHQLINLDISRVPQGTWILKTGNANGTRKGSAKIIRL